MKKYIGLILIGLFLLAIMVSLWRVMQYSFLIKLSLELLILVILFPFIYLVILNIQGKQGDELKIYGVGFKDFMTTWIAFWGLLGVSIGVIQVQHQIKSQKEQFDTQIQIQQKQLRDSRFSSGVELLGNQNESARIGGAYNLYFLASEYPDEYLNPVCEILCSHIRTITSDKEYQEKYKEKPSNETQTIINLLLKKNKNGKLIFNDCVKNFVGTFLYGADFREPVLSSDVSDYLNNNFYLELGKLSNIDFSNAKLGDIRFLVTELNNVSFRYAELSNIWFNVAILHHVIFFEAKLDNISFIDGAVLKDVSFMNAKLCNVDFRKAEFENIDRWKIDFSGTILENSSYEEIIERSLELTKENCNNE